jgi:DNA repair exonuclease SbcCD ATPase subunit
MKQRADDSVRSSFNGSEKSKTTTRRGPSTNEPPTISAESHTKSVQTNETAFVPCESCAKVQANLKQNADQLINICHYQNLPSQVGKYRSSLNGSQLTGGWLNGPDMDKWLAEQDKDLAKIGKHLEFVSKNNELLKVKLSESEAAGQKYVTLEKELKKTLKDEQELRTIQMKQYEKKIADQKAELQAKIASLETELGQLKAIKVNLEQKFESLKNLNDNNEKIIVELSKISFVYFLVSKFVLTTIRLYDN